MSFTDQVPTEPVQEAIELINAGKHREASTSLARFLEQDPGHEGAWLLLSYAVQEPDKQSYALQRVLQINPENKMARSQLERLYRDKVTPDEAASPAPKPKVSVETRAPRWERLITIARSILARPSLIAGLLIVLLFFIIAATAPLIAPPEDPDNPYLIPQYGFGSVPKPPSADHPLGLTARQHDVLYGLVWGTRTVLKVGLFVTLGRVLIGVVVGLVAGHYGRFVDATIMRVTDAFMAFPIIAAVMVMVALFARQVQAGPGDRMFLVPSREEQVIVLALVAFGWMSYARLLRGNVLAEREKDYMQAALAMGASNRRVIFRHLLPNVTQGLYVMAASDIGAVVVLLTMFTFIGLVRAPMGMMEADWGQMLSVARDWIVGSPSNAFVYWYTYIPLCVAILLFSIGWNLIGDGLRDVMDPRLRIAFPGLRRGG